MIRVNLPKNLVDAHWKWFEKILDDVEDWTLPKEKQDTKQATNKIQRRKFIYNQFGFTNDMQIRDLICADYQTMRDMIKQPLYVSKIYYRSNSKNSGTGITKEDRDALIRALGYEEFTNLEEPYQWGAYTFCQNLGVNVCPYCNRQYIFTVVKQKKWQPQGSNRTSEHRLVRPQIEHFFPKSKYPFFSCSIYNMIPGCSICNLKKSSVDTFLHPMIYPYEEEFGQKGRFFVDFDVDKINENDDLIFDKELENDIHVKIASHDGKKLDAKIKQSVKKLILEELYNCHQLEIKNILKRYRLTTKANINRYSLMNLDATFAKNIILGRPLCGNGTDYPLRKLNEDIIEQFDGKKKNK